MVIKYAAILENIEEWAKLVKEIDYANVLSDLLKYIKNQEEKCKKKKEILNKGLVIKEILIILKEKYANNQVILKNPKGKNN